MLSIQQAGMEILGDNPKSLYFFCGVEYGVKNKYIEHLKTYYSNYVEADEISDIFKSFERKSLLASSDNLYVCRYDLQFIKSLDDKYVNKIQSYRIPGTVVMVYDDDKLFNKLDKLFPDNVIRFDNISLQFVDKYLHQDYPDIPERYIHLISSQCDSGYGQARVICGQLDNISGSLGNYSDSEILETFALGKGSTEDQLKIAVAAKSFSTCLNIVESFDGDKNYLINCMCVTMIELDKLMDKKNSDSNLQKYVKHWSRQDVYYLFNHCYNMLIGLRSYSSSDVEDSIVWLLSLLRFNNIPSPDSISYKD